jgi:hypothetical protein
MSETYFVTFTIGKSGDPSERYQEMLAAVRRLTSDLWWTEASHFLLFQSEHSIDEVAARIAAVLHLDADLALLSRADAAEARAIGAIEDPLLFEIMPYAQRYHG